MRPALSQRTRASSRILFAAFALSAVAAICAAWSNDLGFSSSSVVKIARPLQIRVIAQAIEDVSLLPLLQSLGIDGYQGHASGRPARIA